MEVSNKLEIRLLVIARKIRQFNEHIEKLKKLQAHANIPASVQMRDELEREFLQLSEQIRAAVLVA
jgi:hypothetical protein